MTTGAPVVQATREKQRVAVSAQVVAAGAVLRQALREQPDRESALDPLERLELSDLIRRVETFASGVAQR